MIWNYREARVLCPQLSTPPLRFLHQGRLYTSRAHILSRAVVTTSILGQQLSKVILTYPPTFACAHIDP